MRLKRRQVPNLYGLPSNFEALHHTIDIANIEYMGRIEIEVTEFV